MKKERQHEISQAIIPYLVRELDTHLESVIHSNEGEECTLPEKIRALNLCLLDKGPVINGYYSQRCTATGNIRVNELMYAIDFYALKAKDGCSAVDDHDLIGVEIMLEDGVITETEYEFIVNEMPNAQYWEPAMEQVTKHAIDEIQRMRNELTGVRRLFQPGDMVTFCSDLRLALGDEPIEPTVESGLLTAIVGGKASVLANDRIVNVPVMCLTGCIGVSP